MVYDANAASDNKVRIRSYSYGEYGRDYRSIKEYGEPHYYKIEKNNSQTHKVSCTKSGCSFVEYQQHFIEGYPGYGTCAACGYSGYISIGTTSLPDEPVME